MDVIFSSKLSRKYKDDLEELLFFNPQQSKIQSKLIEIIDRYGTPMVVIEGDFLRVVIEGLEHVQTLFAFGKEFGKPELIGAMIYVRLNPDALLVLHLGVDESFSSSGEYANQMVVAKFIFKLKEIAKKIKGIQTIEILYGRGEIKKIKI